MPKKHELSSDEESIDSTHEESTNESTHEESTHEESTNAHHDGAHHDGAHHDGDVTNDKKKKLSFEDYINAHMIEFNKFKSELEKANVKDFYKYFTKFVKNEEAFIGKLVKLHEKTGRKTKRKHTENTGKSGFNKPSPVPSAFLKYLDLDEDTEMTRPQLVKLLNVKFTNDGLKNDGEICFSNKKIAKMFSVDKDHTFHAKDYHKFIASYYNKSAEKSAKT